MSAKLTDAGRSGAGGVRAVLQGLKRLQGLQGLAAALRRGGARNAEFGYGCATCDLIAAHALTHEHASDPLSKEPPSRTD